MTGEPAIEPFGWYDDRGSPIGPPPLGRLAQLVRAPALQAGSRGFESLTAHHLLAVLPFTSFQSGFRLRARTPALRLKFESLTAHHLPAVLPFTSFQSGFRLRARTPALRLKFESLTAHHLPAVLPFTSFQSGFCLRARTPARRLNFRAANAHLG